MHNVTLVHVDEILPREKSQRAKPEGVAELAESIRRIGLINAIVVDSDLRLVAGGNRLEAYKLLKTSDTSGKWDMIPALLVSELNSTDRKLLELEENVRRKDLTWQEHALAVLDLDELMVETRPELVSDERAACLGMSSSQRARLLRAARELRAGNARVAAAPTLIAADNIITREAARTQDNAMNKLFETIAQDTTETAEEPIEPELPLEGDVLDLTAPVKFASRVKPVPARVIRQGNFIEFAENYSGERFNFLHCDFPYGIGHGESAQGGAVSRWDAYEDDSEIYWTLLRAMLNNRTKLMLPSTHIIFWFSMKYYSETIQMFNELAPEMVVDHQPLIWHKTDNKGIIRNIDHTPRNVYETALFITRGERRIIKAVGNAYGAPTRKATAGHISEKPVPVLRHFFQLCCDNFTEILDPTAGSGTALRAAQSMGASRLLGLELNQQYADFAQKEYDQQLALSSFVGD